MSRENFRTPFSELCHQDLEELRDNVLSASDVLEKYGEYSEEYAVTSLLKLADDMIEYLKKENH